MSDRPPHHQSSCGIEVRESARLSGCPACPKYLKYLTKTSASSPPASSVIVTAKIEQATADDRTTMPQNLTPRISPAAGACLEHNTRHADKRARGKTTQAHWIKMQPETGCTSNYSTVRCNRPTGGASPRSLQPHISESHLDISSLTHHPPLLVKNSRISLTTSYPAHLLMAPLPSPHSPWLRRSVAPS